MIGLILSGLGSAARAAGLGSLGAGLTAAGTALNSLGGGIPGAGAPAAGAATPAAMPFGLNLSRLAAPVSTNLGTSASGWSTTVTPVATPGQQFMGDALKIAQSLTQPQQQQQTTQPQAPTPQAPAPAPRQPVDFSKLLEAVSNRAKLGV